MGKKEIDSSPKRSQKKKSLIFFEESKQNPYTGTAKAPLVPEITKPTNPAIATII